VEVLRSSGDSSLWDQRRIVCSGQQLFDHSRLRRHTDFFRFPAVDFFAVNVFFWGVAALCMATCTTFRGFFVCRFLLGGFEALLIPTITMLISMWYRPEEQPKRNR
jgi:MFS family permease